MYVVVYVGRDRLIHIATCYNSQHEAQQAATLLTNNHNVTTGIQELAFSAN